GDNFAYVGYMNGHPFDLFGGTNYYFFDAYGYRPGETALGAGDLWLYSTVMWIGNTPTEFDFLNPGVIFATSITLPTDGRSFRAFVDVGFYTFGINYDTGETIDLFGGAKGSIDFYYSPEAGRYIPGGFVQAPEPGTLALIGTGLLGIPAAVRKRLRM